MPIFFWNILYEFCQVSLQELRTFDLRTGAAVFLAAPDSPRYGLGFVRTCGSCVEFCARWPGETREHHVQTRSGAVGRQTTVQHTVQNEIILEIQLAKML